MKFTCPKCGRAIEMSEHALYMAGNRVVCTGCASRLVVDGGYAYILSDKVTDNDFTQQSEQSAAQSAPSIADPEVSTLYDDAVRYLGTCNAITLPMLQRYFDIPAERAMKLMTVLEQNGIVGPYNGGAPRRILIPHREDLPFATRRRRGDAVDQAIEQMRQDATNSDNGEPPMRSFSCGCSTFSLILFGLLLLYFLLRACH
ncbi:MAG: hypothetical protein IJ835_00185 [Muribaculaceae bacterium]|nr:hypothetical protein [Muribaculaceae bacterium]